MNIKDNCLILVLMILNSFSILNAQTVNEIKIEDEIEKLFNGIPVQEGIDSIMAKSQLNFDYSVDMYIDGTYEYHESWATLIEEFQYLDSPTKKIKLELGQGCWEEATGCYDVSLRLFYDNEEIRKTEFFRIKENFEKLGEKVDTETILTEEYDLKDQTVIVYLKKGYETPSIGFSISNGKTAEDFQIFIHYKNCNSTVK